ncbi:aminotransferase class I/II-fold pyridoxal phosphate-dependent enzyme [Mycobacterium hodleri]|uniref:Aminotransferase class I/II-fold pyridoxal phosphate-dependent enzyme n=1 Tax=Mycolicibacterium hodleri TaxID=49897 RepID=A0A544VZ74_9MYCO|nr:aminotransferase class I/II-fold pyridoxal phosphate-dependent enzyme [Mycolicibacterium hodleri]TQR85264.1 aminotransferase class I/II-fold pyridoxal phosphate-dependent enzyme [Mycolicibacterium hodleri]
MSRDPQHAYNSAWQLRGDAWCRLDEAADRLTRTTTTGELKDEYVGVCQGLLATLAPLEPYWAYPGTPQFAKVQRQFAAGHYDKFAHAVARINRALTTESYRSGEVDTAGMDDTDMFPADPRTLEQHPVGTTEDLYFEVLVVEKMTEAQERALRKEVRSWRRPDDQFRYELVIVASGDEALIAARLNVNLQAVVIRRRFSHQSTRDLTSLADFVDTRVSEELDDHKSPDERAQILAESLRELRPELDMYLMTEIDVEQIAGRLGPFFRRVFHAREGVLELHLSILQGVAERYRTPFFSALKQYSHRPTGVFHALPISQGKSIVNSHWIKDMVGFYGLDVFMAETSATCGGLDSLLEPTGPLRDAQQLAAEAYGSRHTYFVTNGTSTANKIVTQSLVAPGDIVLLDRNCHQSHHYGMMMAGANVVYLEAYPLADYTMYGAIPLHEIKSKLLALKAAGKLDRVKMMSLTNCTFDGIVYDVERVMEECLAIKPDLVFLWDEAWFAFARFHPVYRGRTAMAAARNLRDRLKSDEYRREYETDFAPSASDAELLGRRLRPDPATARVRVYATQSTHKTLTSLRQGSMIHVFDQDFEQKVAEAFHEAYMAHTSTSPNYQILASLDLGRRQVALEGVELVQRQIENAMQLRDAIDNHPLLSKYMECLRTSDLIPDAYRDSHIAQPLRSGLRNMMTAWENDEFVLDPSRITLSIGRTGYDGDTFKREQLMDRHGVQINKTSRNTVLFMTNIGTTRSSVAFLVEVLVKIAGELDEGIGEMGLGERGRFEQKVRSLTTSSAAMPNFSGFHEVFRDHSGAEPTPEGDVRRAFYLSYDDTNCEYLTGDEVFDKLDNGIDVVSATFVTPYPPGFPVLVPGQVFSREILTFIRDLDTPEIHGYKPEFGYRVYTQKAIEMCGPVLAPTGGQAASRGGEAEPIVEPGPAPLVLTQTVPSGLAPDHEPESGVSDEPASAGAKSGTVTRKARSQRERGGD